MNVTQYSKYALSIFFILVLYVAYLLLKPFLLTILTAVILDRSFRLIKHPCRLYPSHPLPTRL